MQVLLEREAAHVALVHARGEELRLIAPELFRAVHRRVGALEQRLDVVAVRGEAADADARGDEEIVAVDAERVRQGVEDLARDARHRLGVRDFGQ